MGRAIAPAVLLIAATLPPTAAAARFFLPDGVIASPTHERFSVCHAHGCREISTLSLTPEQWQRLRAEFAPPATTPAEERAGIARAIGRLERIAGPLTGTGHDLAGAFDGLGREGQMDCIDESVNTTTYLRMLADSGLLRHHRIEPRSTRGFFLFGWPHTTAVIRESESGKRSAVDSWFHPNGVEPEIVPLKRWRAGHHPREEQ